jgi:hypothetical protein
VCVPAVDLDDESRVGPEEVDGPPADALLRERRGQAEAPTQPEEAILVA